jgi:hypothetical protein
MQLKGVDLSIRGDQLHFRAPAGVMTPSLRQELAARKEELLLYLRDAGLRQEPSVEANRDRRAPLSFAQERIWFLVQLNPESPFYNVAWAITLVGRLDVEALRHSLQHVVRRHDVFRTVCTTIEDERVQLVTTDKDVEFEMLDLRRVPQAKRKGSAARLVREKARRTFDLSTDVLLRATLLRLQEQEFILLLTTHHFATDGWSVRFLLMREVSELYAYAASGVTPSLPELPIQYADFATWQRRTARNLFHDQLQYWMGSLDGAPDLLLLPACRRRPDIQTYRGRAEFLSLPKTLSDRLRAFSRSERVTPFMTLLAAFQTLLYRYTGTDDIVVGTVTSNRNLKEIEQSIGPFANNLVLRTDFSGLPTFRQLLARVRENTVAAYAHQDVPFELVVQHIFPRRDLGRHPIFQVAFVCHDSLPEGNLKLQGLDVKGVRIGTGTARFDLAVEVSVGEAEMSGFVEYSSDLFDSATIKRLLAHYRRILESIVTDPDQSVSKLPLMTKSERRKLLSRSSLQLTNQSPGTQKRTVVALFEEQVQRTPDATVEFRGSRVVLQGVESFSEPVCPTLDGGWSQTRRPRRYLPRAVTEDGCWFARHTQGGWGLRADGPEISRITSALHGGRCRCFCFGYGKPGARQVPKVQGKVDRSNGWRIGGP